MQSVGYALVSPRGFRIIRPKCAPPMDTPAAASSRSIERFSIPIPILKVPSISGWLMQPGR